MDVYLRPVSGHPGPDRGMPGDHARRNAERVCAGLPVPVRQPMPGDRRHFRSRHGLHPLVHFQADQAVPGLGAAAKGIELRAAGRDVHDLASGELDFPTPAHVIAAAAEAMHAGETKYTLVQGKQELREAIASKVLRLNGLAYDPGEISATNGSAQALSGALAATLRPGDEVVVPVPCWGSYRSQVILAGGRPVPVGCSRDNGFKLMPDDLQAALTGRTRWLVLNNPVNPTGVVYSKSELAALADVLLDRPEVWVLADGLYEEIVFDGSHAVTMAEAQPLMQDRTLLVGGVAKAYSMTGWRIGWARGPRELVAEMTKIQSQTTPCASSVSQAAAAAVLTGPQYVVTDQARILGSRRDRFLELLDAVPGVSSGKADGAFYLFPSYAGLLGTRRPDGRIISSDRDVAADLLDAANLVALPGADCDASPYYRVSFAREERLIEEAGERLRDACSMLFRDRSNKPRPHAPPSAASYPADRLPGRV